MTKQISLKSHKERNLQRNQIQNPHLTPDCEINNMEKKPPSFSVEFLGVFQLISSQGCILMVCCGRSVSSGATLSFGQLLALVLSAWRSDRRHIVSEGSEAALC